MKLEQWLKQPGADQHRAILEHSPAIGIHDVRAIDAIRADLWHLEDYYVSAVQAGVIWLCPKQENTK